MFTNFQLVHKWLSHLFTHSLVHSFTLLLYTVPTVHVYRLKCYMYLHLLCQINTNKLCHTRHHQHCPAAARRNSEQFSETPSLNCSYVLIFKRPETQSRHTAQSFSNHFIYTSLPRLRCSLLQRAGTSLRLTIGPPISDAHWMRWLAESGSSTQYPHIRASGHDSPCIRRSGTQIAASSNQYKWSCVFDRFYVCTLKY